MADMDISSTCPQTGHVPSRGPIDPLGIDRHEVLFIIPARGGSKGLPGKNIRNLCGKPLLAYSIEAALAVRRPARVIVSTEDPNIAAVAREHGAEVPFLRPVDLAKDNSCLGDVVNYTLQMLKQDRHDIPNVLVLLLPTHPFRSREMMNLLVDKAAAGHRNVATVRPCPIRSLYTRHENDALKSASFGPASRQGELGYRFYGLFHSATQNWCKPNYTHIVTDDVSLIDIDTLADFLLAEEVIKQGLFNFNGTNAS